MRLCARDFAQNRVFLKYSLVSALDTNKGLESFVRSILPLLASSHFANGKIHTIPDQPKYACEPNKAITAKGIAIADLLDLIL